VFGWSKRHDESGVVRHVALGAGAILQILGLDPLAGGVDLAGFEANDRLPVVDLESLQFLI